jgi:transcriptional regulator with XRE-family HTH domain
MEVKSGGKSNDKRRRQQWTPELNAILRGGYAKGRLEAALAIDEVQRRTGRSRASIYKHASRQGFASDVRPWAKADEACALELSTERPTGIIARYLRRTLHSVQCKLSRLGRTTKCLEGYTQADLAEQFGLNRAAIRWFLNRGWLKPTRDRLPNPDREDLKLDPLTTSLNIPRPKKDGARRYKRISEESVQQFLREHPEEVPYWRLDPDKREWLAQLGFKPKDNRKVRQLSKHVNRIHKCEWCARKTPGNAHFRHVRRCPKNPVNLRFTYGS